MPDDEIPVRPGNPAGFMAYHQSIGTSARGALDEWRSNGGTSADRAWYRMWGNISDSIFRRDNFAGVQPDVLPSESDYGVWAMGQGGQYATQVSVTIVDIDTGIESDTPFTYVTAEPHTPEEAQDAGIAAFSADDAAARYKQVVTGAFATDLWRTEPFNA